MAKGKKDKLVSVGFVSLGCAKNIVDSERMLAEIAQSGFAITADADNADVVVINTCAFIEPARAEAIEAIEQAVGRKRAGAVRKVVVAGCLAEREGEGLFGQAEGIDAIVGLAERDNIGRIVGRVIGQKGPVGFVGGVSGSIHDDRVRLRITPRHYAYLRISEGCSRGCSFCTIPAIRGPFRSKPKELVVAEAKELVASGAVELNIIGQDTSSYGRDIGVEGGLAELLGELEGIENLRWIRLMYLYPSGVDERLIEAIGSSEKIVNYLDIPIQHINDGVLRRMHRAGGREQICRLIEKLRSKLAGCVLRTTVIVGFPGEGQEEFEELVEFVKWAEFDQLGCFTFYAESGTVAAEMPGQVPDEVKQQRRDELMLTQQAIVLEKNTERIGQELDCLVESVESDGRAKGRFYGQAPEIDSECLIKKCSVGPGRFCRVRIVGSRGYDLVCEEV